MNGKAIRLPGPIQRRIDRASLELLQAPGAPALDFSQPRGEAALLPADSVSWRVFKNPLALFIGGIAAVVLELAEPRVRSGVWQHTSFRERPRARMQRTGAATMVTVYGARSRAEPMIAAVARLHERIGGTTPAGQRYRATETELLDWVHATASFGFVEAYETWVRRLDDAARDRYYAEGQAAARLYGASGMPRSQAELHTLFELMQPRLERSDIVFEFLRIMAAAPMLPGPLRALQPLLVKAAVDITPGWLRERLGLGADWNLRPWQRRLVGKAARGADRLLLAASPPVQACRRLGLPDDYLYR